MEEEFLNTPDRENLDSVLYDYYKNYSAYIILNRAIPRIEDGLLCVQRKLLYHMLQCKYYNGVKSQRVCGPVSGLYYPHGDMSLYGSLVKMASEYYSNLRLVIGQGGFGGVDKEAPASSRYTQVKLSKLSKDLFEELDTAGIEMIPNYDGTCFEPRYLPTKLPLFLLNNICGIAVGISSNIPSHNKNEVILACINLIKDPEHDVTEDILGPEFAIPCTITNQKEIKDIYYKGNGSFKLRAMYHIKGDTICITSFPYNSSKERFFSELKNLLETNVIQIKNLRDKTTTKTLIEIEADNPDFVIKVLLNKTCLTSFASLNMNLLVGGSVRLLNLKESLDHFINNRRVIVKHKTQLEIDKFYQSVFKNTGQLYLYTYNQEIINIVKHKDKKDLVNFINNNPFDINKYSVENKDIYEKYLHKKFSAKSYANERAEGILSLTIRSLGVKEIKNTEEKISDTLDKIRRNHLRLSDQSVFNNYMIDELSVFLDKEERTCPIINSEKVAMPVYKEQVIRMLTEKGSLIKVVYNKIPLQNRAGKGKKYSDSNILQAIKCCSSHKILCYTNMSKGYVATHKMIDQKYFHAEGTFKIAENEKMNKIFSIDPDSEYSLVVKLSGKCYKIKTDKLLINNISGFKLSNITDPITDIKPLKEQYNGVILSNGKKILYMNDALPTASSKTAVGVKCIKNQNRLRTFSLVPETDQKSVYAITKNGSIKRFLLETLRSQKRGGQGTNIISSKYDDSAICIIGEQEEVLIVNKFGILLKTNVSNLRSSNKSARGVKVINLAEGESVLTVL